MAYYKFKPLKAAAKLYFMLILIRKLAYIIIINKFFNII